MFALSFEPSKTPNPSGNWCDRPGANELKAKIEAYWAERGHSVMVTVHESAFHPAIRSTRFDVRSDMINGLPRPPAIEDRRAA